MRENGRRPWARAQAALSSAWLRMAAGCRKLWQPLTAQGWGRLSVWFALGLVAGLIYTHWPPQPSMLPGVSAKLPPLETADDVPSELENAASPAEISAPSAAEPQPAMPQSVPESETEDNSAVAVLARMPAFQPEEAVLPVLGRVTREHGWYRHPQYGDWRLSPGVEFRPERPQEPVYAAYAGIVATVAKEADGSGWRVLVDHPNHWRTEYGGLEEVAVYPQDVVEAGTQLGWTSRSGEGSVCFVLRRDDEPVDPTPYLSLAG